MSDLLGRIHEIGATIPQVATLLTFISDYIKLPDVRVVDCVEFYDYTPTIGFKGLILFDPFYGCTNLQNQYFHYMVVDNNVIFDPLGYNPQRRPPYFRDFTNYIDKQLQFQDKNSNACSLWCIDWLLSDKEMFEKTFEYQRIHDNVFCKKPIFFNMPNECTLLKSLNELLAAQ